MSQATQPTDEPETELTKTVTLACYLDREESETRRQFADRVDERRDYFSRSREETTITDFFLRGHDFEKTLDEDEYERLVEQDLGDLEAVKEEETEESSSFDYRPSKPLQSMVEDLFDQVCDGEEEFEFGMEKKWLGSGLSRDGGGTPLRFYTNFERMPMLKHQSEISEDEMYEDEEEEHLVFKVRMKMTKVTEEELDYITEEFISPMMTLLARHDWINKVRTFDCEMKTKEKGVCWRI